MDGHRGSGTYGKSIGVDDDEARLTTLLGLALALQEHVREHYPEDSEARKREALRRTGEEVPF